KTVVTVIVGNSLKGLIALRDSLREDSQEAIAQLKKQGVNSLILTGDNQYAAKAVASLLGTKVQSELLPEAKLTAIEDLKRTGTIAMVGDGINDAPALAAAHVGIALG